MLDIGAIDKGNRVSDSKLQAHIDMINRTDASLSFGKLGSKHVKYTKKLLRESGCLETCKGATGGGWLTPNGK
jgi:hypothetical protein